MKMIWTNVNVHRHKWSAGQGIKRQLWRSEGQAHMASKQVTKIPVVRYVKKYPTNFITKPGRQTLRRMCIVSQQLGCNGQSSRSHSLTNRHSPKRSMHLILVVGKVDMINQVCQMLSSCWKLLSAYFAEKWLLRTLLSTVVTAKLCMY